MLSVHKPISQQFNTSDNGYFNHHQNILLCVPNTSKNQKARDSGQTEEGGMERRVDRKENVCLCISSWASDHRWGFTDAVTGREWIIYVWMGVRWGMNLHSGKSIFHTEESSSMLQHCFAQRSRRSTLFLERWLLPEIKRESGTRKRVDLTGRVSEYLGQRDKVRNWKSTIVSSGHWEACEIHSQLIAYSLWQEISKWPVSTPHRRHYFHTCGPCPALDSHETMILWPVLPII